MNQLPTCLDINAECDNEPCMFHHDHKCTFHCRQWRHVNTGYQNQSEREKVLDIGEILESLCKTDLYWYNKGVTEGEDVGKCRGKDCNYCGRYNEKLRQQADEP